MYFLHIYRLSLFAVNEEQLLDKLKTDEEVLNQLSVLKKR